MNKGVPQNMIANYGNRLNPKEMNKILGIYQSGRNTQQPPTMAPIDPLASTQNSLSQAMSRTSEETSAEQALSDLAYKKQLGLDTEAGRAVPMGFVTGAQAAIERSAATATMPLEAQLRRLQEKRQTATDIAKSQLESAQWGAEQARRKSEFEQSLAEQVRASKAQEKNNAMLAKLQKKEFKLKKDLQKFEKKMKVRELSQQERLQYAQLGNQYKMNQDDIKSAMDIVQEEIKAGKFSDKKRGLGDL